MTGRRSREEHVAARKRPAKSSTEKPPDRVDRRIPALSFYHSICSPKIKMMNYIRHLNAFFFQHVKWDRRLNANHITLYLALFQYWNYHRFQNPFYIARDEVLSITG